jgi:DNA-binding NarL/FixJ family response regulator
MTDALTDRELEILACLAEGLSNQEIANRQEVILIHDFPPGLWQPV